eukprot:scaffold35181_cov24-Phaeocystis_antarctica.AAC.3
MGHGSPRWRGVGWGRGMGSGGGLRRTQTEMDEMSVDRVSLAVKHAHRAQQPHPPLLPLGHRPRPGLASAAHLDRPVTHDCGGGCGSRG